MKIAKRLLLTVLVAAITLGIVFGGFLIISATYRSNPKNVQIYETTNPCIRETTDIVAHRSGAGIVPEQTMMAFKYCAENLKIDTFEFDLHITKDNKLVLLHDDTLDRVSDAEEVFGQKDVLAHTKTYDELRMLNMGADFIASDGSMPYADLKEDEVPGDLKILCLDEALDYLTLMGEYY